MPLVTREGFSPSYVLSELSRYDAVTGRVTKLVPNVALNAAATADRRTLYRGIGIPPTLLDERYGVPLPMPAPVQTGRLDATGTTVFFTSADASILPGGADTNGVEDVFAVDLLSRLDRDSDGLDDRWEVAMGLDYTSASGRRRRRRRPGRRRPAPTRRSSPPASHPRGSQRRFLAEGAENAFFKHAVRAGQPGRDRCDRRRFASTATTASSTTINVHVPAGARRTVFVDEVDAGVGLVRDGRRVERADR